ncbi:SDR family NAD(P)-dependent oxidoreductase [Microbacterium sp.]|uniref:SDR family NAD(P)-dependent oxidoreductase n=1 Tax=Microbacterium sp. TaxID=51671 RepID=UPI003A8B3F8D
MGSIEGKTVVITGAGSGIGQAIARRFAADGATVVATDVNDKGLAELDGVDGILTTHADVTSWDEVKAAVDFAVAKTGKIDVYINDAGIAMEQTIVDTDVERFDLLHRIHVNGCLYGMKAALGYMREQGSGHILNVISRVAETATTGVSAYASAKAAMWSLTRIGAAENADKGILVNALFPGISRTAMTEDGSIGDPSKLGAPDQEYDTFKMLATLDAGGPSGKVWFHGQEYPMFQAENDLGAVTGGLGEGRAKKA